MIKKFIYYFGLYCLFGRVYKFLHSKPDPQKLEKIAAIFTTPGTAEEAKFMGIFGFHKKEEDNDDEEEVEKLDRIGF